MITIHLRSAKPGDMLFAVSAIFTRDQGAPNVSHTVGWVISQSRNEACARFQRVCLERHLSGDGWQLTSCMAEELALPDAIAG